MATERLEHFGILSSIGNADILPDVDRAIERAEDDLVRTQPRLYREEISLAEVSLFAKFEPTDLAAIEPYLRRVVYQPGSVIFRKGDPGNELLIIKKRQRQRLSTVAQHEHSPRDICGRHDVWGARPARRRGAFGNGRRGFGPAVLHPDHVGLRRDGGQIPGRRRQVAGCYWPRAKWAAAHGQPDHSSP
jgi:hypothetical protein